MSATRRPRHAGDAARRRADARRESRPVLRCDPGLPIAAKHAEIVERLRREPVLIVVGETGSGKSTQLPQFCLEADRGIEGQIAHTQPRRLAARALAQRIAEELREPVGRTVGYRVRFADRVGDSTRVVLMTDGVLLAELARDRELRHYDTLIIDEAHERSLNVDLLLGIAKRLLAVRADLRVIVTSATLDVERLAAFFGGAPVIDIGGRGHPVEVRYAASPDREEELDLPTAVLQALRAVEEDPGPGGAGDVLAFLPGEREIADVGELLDRELGAQIEIVPLYSRLAWERQRRVFEPGARRRIVLATNVAETSITVPGIRAVIDSGLARISRYDTRIRLQRLPIEKISRASAEQRKGRCGRIGPGVCIRLYDAADFESRPAYTEPEIRRTNLAALLLRLAADGLGAAEEFPFVDPPDRRALVDGYRLLQELGALDAERRITTLGRSMARLPLDPRLSRALVESRRFHAEAEVLAIVAGLSVPEVRLDAGPGGAATPDGDAVPARGAGSAGTEDPKSQFLDLLQLWNAYRAARATTRRELRQWCRERGLSLLRLGEWDDVHAQLGERAAEIGLRPGARAASYAMIHRALLAGFCTIVGVRAEEGVYVGPRGLRFRLFPGSALARRRPRWVMAADVVETRRIYARRIAEIDPGWIETAAAHLLKREYLAIDWDERRGEVVARERVSLFGLVIAERRVNYGPIAPAHARQVFVREALVHGRLAQRPDWLAANDAAIAAARGIEDRLRTRGLVAEAEALVASYERRLPPQVSSGVALERHTRTLDPAGRARMGLEEQEIFVRRPDPDALAAFPVRVAIGTLAFDVEYRFAPGDPRDGATLRVPVIALPELGAAALAAAIPGLARPRVEAWMRALPKEARRRLIPIAATAARFLEERGLEAATPESLAEWLRTRGGLGADADRIATTPLEPEWLAPRVAVIEAARELACGTHLAALRALTAEAAGTSLRRAAAERYPQAWTRFEADALPLTAAIEGPNGTLTVHPALAVDGEAIRVAFERTAAEAAHRHRRGATRLALRVLGRVARDAAREVAEDAPLMLGASPFVEAAVVVDGLVASAVRYACFGDGEPPRSRDAFDAAVDAGRSRLPERLAQSRAVARAWFDTARAVRSIVILPRVGPAADAAAETQAHLQRLLRAGLDGPVRPWDQRIAKYLLAEERRWRRDARRGAEPPSLAGAIRHATARRDRLAAAVEREGRWLPALEDLGWWIEEYRISLVAQEIGTIGSISAERLEARAAEIEAWLKR
ncbi:MAG: ATP-dependent RNA helicase HrpA [Gammaproteobacteria bacterium]|nr:ATP-dependent RNA helicase HrpA [Gammaproteobacteria bacterium]